MLTIHDLVKSHGVEGLVCLPRDASAREYYRGRQGLKSVIVMAYPEVNDKTRAELHIFMDIAARLRGVGLKAPMIAHVDEGEAFAILEDFGQVSFGRAVREGGDRTAFYALAIDVLKVLKNSDISKNLPPYHSSRIHENRRQIIDYYAPLKFEKTNKNNILNDYLNVLNEIETALPPCPVGFVHGDFHLENLMWISEGEGLNRCGIIDFQDALYAPLPYDLVNLLEDARVDVPPDLRAAMFDRYCAGMSSEEKEAFSLWYRFLGTQFHCRVIGLFIKFAVEQNRDQYLVHVPRLQNYIAQGLEHPIMRPLKLFFEKEKIDFLPLEAMNGEWLRAQFQNKLS